MSSVFVPWASAVMQLKMIYNHKEIKDMCIRSDCMSDHSLFTLLRHVVSVICLHFIYMIEGLCLLVVNGPSSLPYSKQGC